MNPTFSLCHATWGRPEKAFAAFKRAMLNTFNRRTEYIFAVNSDDTPTLQMLGSLSDHDCGLTRIVTGGFSGSAPAWDAAAKASTGDILIQMQDDLELPDSWDEILMEWLEGANLDPSWWREVPVVVAVRDGYRRDALLCTAICNRRRYEQRGHFICPEFWSVFSDDDFSYAAYRDERDGECAVIRTDSVFRHEHHYHNPAVPDDLTYQRENSPEAYRLGAELFARRNPEAATDGLVTWR